MLDKPIYVGFSTMDLSWLLKHDFHYSYIKAEHGCGAKLLLADTDSLVFEIKTDDGYENFYGDKNLFNFSDYPKDLRFYDPFNKKVLAKWKMKLKEISLMSLLY